MGGGVAWDPCNQNHLWGWFGASNQLHLYDIERCSPDAPTAVLLPLLTSRTLSGYDYTVYSPHIWR